MTNTGKWPARGFLRLQRTAVSEQQTCGDHSVAYVLIIHLFVHLCDTVLASAALHEVLKSGFSSEK